MKGSITKSFGALLKGDLPQQPTDPQRAPARVGAGVVGAASRSLTDIRQERDDLRAQLASAAGNRELDPSVIDPSPFPDRLAETNDLDFASLKQLIGAEGQKVPIQVRPHPTVSGRYQVIFGHRRWRAARELDRKVKAEIVSASDEELAIAQGIENSARQDLSWIERAQFARRLEEANIKPRHIKAALSVDDAELTKFRAVCRALPCDIIEDIGRAPKVGRPRWAELARLVTEKSSLEPVRKTLAAAKASQTSSDERFRAVLATLTKPKKASAPRVLKLSGGELVGTLVVSGDGLRFALSDKHADDLADFMASELPHLIERFHTERRKE